MKEFIEKLIGRLEELGWVYADYYPDETAIHRQRKKSVVYEEVVEIVNQLAEEYNNDFCEWHKVKNGNAYKCNTHAEIHDSRVLDWYVCPYCEKKIKMVE